MFPPPMPMFWFTQTVKDLAGGDVARHEVAVGGVLLLEEVPALGIRELSRVARESRVGLARPA